MMMKNLLFNVFFVLIASILSAGGFFLFTFCNIFRCRMVIALTLRFWNKFWLKMVFFLK